MHEFRKEVKTGFLNFDSCYFEEIEHFLSSHIKQGIFLKGGVPMISYPNRDKKFKFEGPVKSYTNRDTLKRTFQVNLHIVRKTP